MDGVNHYRDEVDALYDEIQASRPMTRMDRVNAIRESQGLDPIEFQDPTGPYQSGDFTQGATAGTRAAPSLGEMAREAFTTPNATAAYALGAELTGVPSIMRGTERIGNSEGDPRQIARGAFDVGIGALPGLGAIGRMGAPALVAATAYRGAPIVAGGVAAAYSDDADAKEAERKVAEAAAKRTVADDRNPDFVLLRERFADAMVKRDPDGPRLLAAYNVALEAKKNIVSQKVEGSKQINAKTGASDKAEAALNKAQADLDAVRNRTLADANDKARAVITARGEANQAADSARAGLPPTSYQQYEKFRANNPGVPLPPMSALPLVAGGIMTAVPGALRTAANWMGRGQASNALKSAKGAQASDDTAGFNRNLAYAEAKADAHARAPDTLFHREDAVPAIAGAVIGAAPRGLDAMTVPDINPERTAGNAFMSKLVDADPDLDAQRFRISQIPEMNPAKVAAQDPMGYARNMFFGALEGWGGAKLGRAATDMVNPGFSLVRSEIDALQRSLPRPPQGTSGGGQGPQSGAPPGGSGGSQQSPPQHRANPSRPPEPYSPRHKDLMDQYLDQFPSGTKVPWLTGQGKQAARENAFMTDKMVDGFNVFAVKNNVVPVLRDDLALRAGNALKDAARVERAVTRAGRSGTPQGNQKIREALFDRRLIVGPNAKFAVPLATGTGGLDAISRSDDADQKHWSTRQSRGEGGRFDGPPT